MTKVIISAVDKNAVEKFRHRNPLSRQSSHHKIKETIYITAKASKIEMKKDPEKRTYFGCSSLFEFFSSL